MSPRGTTRRRPGRAGRLLTPVLLGLAGCTTMAPVTEAGAHASAQQAFEAVLAHSGWRADQFAPGAMTQTDTGWMVAYRCKADTRGALVILVERDGAAGYSLAPPAAAPNRARSRL